MQKSAHALEMSWRMVEVVQAGLKAAGIDDRPVLAKYGLTRDDSRGEQRIPHDVGIALLLESVRVTGDPAFGLHAAERYQPGAHVFEYLALNSPTLGDMLERVCRYYRLIIDAAAPSLEVDGAVARWHFRMPGHEPLPVPLAELVLTTAVLAGQKWLGIPSSPRVAFAFAEPADTREHHRVLGPLVTFSATTNHLEFPSQALSVTLATANPDLFVVLDEHAAMLLRTRPAPDDLIMRVKQLIADGLEGGHAELDDIAKKLHTSGRTLRRRLSELDTSHRQLVDDVRLSLSKEYLGSAKLSLEDIAYLLGFSDASAFHRAFKRWTGATPSEVRRAPHKLSEPS